MTNIFSNTCGIIIILKDMLIMTIVNENIFIVCIDMNIKIIYNYVIPCNKK